MQRRLTVMMKRISVGLTLMKNGLVTWMLLNLMKNLRMIKIVH